jgi:hypothetical protein
MVGYSYTTRKLVLVGSSAVDTFRVRRDPTNKAQELLAQSYFFKSASQFVTKWSGAWISSSRAFTRRL